MGGTDKNFPLMWGGWKKILEMSSNLTSFSSPPSCGGDGFKFSEVFNELSPHMGGMKIATSPQGLGRWGGDCPPTHPDPGGEVDQLPPPHGGE